MKKGLKVKVLSINHDRVPGQRNEILESYVGIAGIVESSHITLNGTINYVKLQSAGLLAQPFYDEELQEI